MINKRLEAANQPDSKWIDILNQVLFVYNYKMEHSATGLTPIQAREEKNLMKVKLNLELHRKSTRKYPEVQIGNKVKIYTKKKQFDKEHVPVWSKTTHIVEDITTSMNQKYFKVSEFRRPLLRHEILLITKNINYNYIMYSLIKPIKVEEFEVEQSKYSPSWFSSYEVFNSRTKWRR